mgnify:FL=1
MAARELLKPLGVFVAVVLVVVAGTALAGFVFGSSGGDGAPDGEDIDGQAPAQYQPDNVAHDEDPENGTLAVDGGGEDRRVLVDTRHSNRFDGADVDPLVEALVREGHAVDVGTEASGGGFESGYTNATLQRYDAMLVIAPTGSFSEREVTGLEAFTDGGGRLVVLGEPRQFSGGGSLSSGSSVRPSADSLAAAYGLRVGSETLYNLDDDANDNNYESVYGTATGGDELTDGVERVQFDTAGYLVRTGDSDAETLVQAVDGTRTADRGIEGEYDVAARNGNFVLVADASLVERSELYDAHNERFVGNLLTFLVSGDKPDDVPPTATPAEDPGGF